MVKNDILLSIYRYNKKMDYSGNQLNIPFSRGIFKQPKNFEKNVNYAGVL